LPVNAFLLLITSGISRVEDVQAGANLGLGRLGSCLGR